MEPVVRPLSEADVEPWVRVMQRGFLADTPDGYGAHLRPEMDLGRTLGAFDGAAVVGTLRSFPTTVVVPGGGEVWGSAVTNVTVATSHRRRGLLTAMMAAELEGAVDRGESAALLIASEYPIYGRFGFGPAVEGAAYELDARSAGLEAGGSTVVAPVEPDELRRVAPACYEAFRLAQPGSIQRTDWWWDRTLRLVEVPGAEPWRGFQAVCRDGAAVTGYVRYHAELRWRDMRPDCVVHVDELVATDTAAYRALWSFVSSVDLATTVVARDRPVVEPLGWMLEDGRALRQTSRFDFVWVRLLDPAAALSNRSYPVEADLVLEVVDPGGPAAGRLHLEAGPDGAACRPTDRAPELVVPVDALGAIWLGGVSPGVLAAAGRLDAPGAAGLRRADALFPTGRPPWCTTWF